MEKLIRLNTPSRTNSFSEWVNFQTILQEKVAHFKTHLEFNGRVYFNEDNDFNYSIPEAFIDYKAKRNEVRIGRQILNWSPEGQYWQLGYLNGLQSFELLGEKEEGLTGINVGRKITDHVDFEVFFSYFFVPQLNPSIEISDGEVSSNSEWVKLPPKRVQIDHEFVRPINYSINRPKLEDVVFKKSLGARVQYRDKNQSYAFYSIYKPENKLRINATADIEGDSSAVNVIANPMVNHHLMFGALAKRKLLENIESSMGVDYIDPNAKLGKDFKIIDPVRLKEGNRYFQTEGFKIDPSYEREAYAHMRLSYRNMHNGVSLRYIHLMTENKRGSDDFFSDTAKWKRTLGLEAYYGLSDNFYILGDYRLDLSREDHILKFEIKYSFAHQSLVRLGIEMIKSPDYISYWSAYRANDAIYTSYQYIF